MDDVEQLKKDVREGRIAPDRLVELLVTVQRQLQEANRRIEELEKKLGGSATVKTAEPFSMRAEEQASGHGARSRQSGTGRCGAAESIRRTRSSGPSGLKKSFLPTLPPTTACCRIRGPCGGWKTAGRCWSRTKFIAARKTNSVAFPARWGAASSDWKSSWRSRIRFTSSECRSTRSAC